MPNFTRGNDPKKVIGVGYGRLNTFILRPDDYHGTPELDSTGRTEPYDKDELQEMYFEAGYNITAWLDEMDDPADDDFNFEDATDEEIDAHEEQKMANLNYDKLFQEWGDYPVYKYIFIMAFKNSKSDETEETERFWADLAMEAEQMVGDDEGMDDDKVNFMNQIMTEATRPGILLYAVSTDPNFPSYKIEEGELISRDIWATPEKYLEVVGQLESIYEAYSPISLNEFLKKRL